MRRFVVRHWFMICLLVVMIAGFGAPRSISPVTAWVPRKPIVAGVLFMMALPLEVRAMWLTLRRPAAVTLAVLANYGLLPLLAWSYSFLLSNDLANGLSVAAAVPSTMASAAVWTRRAGGNDAIPLVVTMLTNGFCFLITPLWLLATTGKDIRADGKLVDLILDLGLLVVTPILAAQVLRLWRPLGQWTVRNKVHLSSVCQIGILLMLFVGAVDGGLKLESSEGASKVSPWDWSAMLLGVGLIHVSVFWAGFAAGGVCRLSRDDSIAIGFSGSQKTLMVGLHIAQTYFGGLTMLPMVAYHAGQLLIDAVIAQRLSRSDS